MCILSLHATVGTKDQTRQGHFDSQKVEKRIGTVCTMMRKIWKAAKPEPRLLKDAARDGPNREREPREVLSQELGSASVVSSSGAGKTNSSAHLVDSETPRERANHEEEQG